MAKLMRFTSGHPHDPRCSGCPACREDYAAMLNETPEETARRLSAHTAHMLRAAAQAQAPVFRVAPWRAHFERVLSAYAPPDPYAPKEPTMSADERKSLGGYADAVAKMRKADR
jgi:hypothetical protein